MIDSYKIFMKNPMQMVRLVRHLREEGYEILLRLKRKGCCVRVMTLTEAALPASFTNAFRRIRLRLRNIVPLFFAQWANGHIQRLALMMAAMMLS